MIIQSGLPLPLELEHVTPRRPIHHRTPPTQSDVSRERDPPMEVQFGDRIGAHFPLFEKMGLCTCCLTLIQHAEPLLGSTQIRPQLIQLGLQVGVSDPSSNGMEYICTSDRSSNPDDSRGLQGTCTEVFKRDCA
jgi:hypothetical protein